MGLKIILKCSLAGKSLPKSSEMWPLDDALIILWSEIHHGGESRPLIEPPALATVDHRGGF
jgi:hypothetical protein